MKIRGILIALGASLLLLPTGRAAVPPGIVEVLITSQNPDPRVPWRTQPPVTRTGFGVVIRPGQVLTVEDITRNATLVEVRFPGTGRRHPARLVQSDAQRNAALLQLDDGGAELASNTVALADGCARGDSVTLAQLDEDGGIQFGSGQVMDIAVSPLPQAAIPALSITVLSTLALDGGGAPVFAGDRLLGLVMVQDSNNQICRVLPAKVLARFLDDLDRPPYEGVATAGFTWAPLLDPAKRAWLQLEGAETGGILVLDTRPGSGAAGVLQPMDVILQWDGQPVDAEGFYPDPVLGRLQVAELISGRRQPGDTIPVSLWRSGRREEVQITLRHLDDSEALVPENVRGERATYLVDAGLVLRELSADYLRSYGPKWMSQASPRLVHVYTTRGPRPEKAGDRVVVLAYVLPDSINIGYQHLRDQIVTRINGEPIRNMADAFRIVDRDGGIRSLSLEHWGTDVILEPADRQAVNRRISQTYRIPTLRNGGPVAAP